MTKLQFFESGQGFIGAKLGIVPVQLLVRYDTYKTYLEHIAAGLSQEEARRNTVESSRCHYSTVARAIYWFERDNSYATHRAIRFQTHANGR
jgi:hypothetical protein